MEITSRIRLHARIQSGIFKLLLVTIAGLLAWLSAHYSFESDWTLNNRHTLSESSQILLNTMPDSITITAYASESGDMRPTIKTLVQRYQRYKDNINIRFVDPFAVPGEVRERGIQKDGELIVEYQERTEHLQNLSEQSLSELLQRLARSKKQMVTFLMGHGERDPAGFANHDLSEWAQNLRRQGIEVNTLNFGENAMTLDKSNVLVIASPQVKLLPGEVVLILEYLENGGNLLWLIDPDTVENLLNLKDFFGLSVSKGVVVDPSSRVFGIGQAYIVSITQYGYHPVTQDFPYLTLFPQACGLMVTPNEDRNWTHTALLTTHEKAWSETGEMEGTVQFDAGADVPGPLDIAIALSREITKENVENVEKAVESADNKATSESSPSTSESEKSKENQKATTQQRIILVGEGDFLSNAFLQNSGNLDLSMNMINWLVRDDSFINIPTKDTVDMKLELSGGASIFIGLFFLIILPLFLIGNGVAIWLRRKKA